MLHKFWDICNSSCFFHTWNLKIGRSRFLLPISNEFCLKFKVCHSSADSKFLSPIMGSDTECLEMLVLLHICLFLILYYNSNMSPWWQWHYHCAQSVQRDVLWLTFGYVWFLVNYSNDISYIVFHSQSWGFFDS